MKETLINSGRNSLYLNLPDSRRRIAREQAIAKIRNAEAGELRCEM